MLQGQEQGTAEGTDAGIYKKTRRQKAEANTI